MMEDGTPLRIGDQVRLRPGSLPPASQFPHYDVTTFVVAHIDRSREAAGDVRVTIRAVAGAAPPLTVHSESLQRAVNEMMQQAARSAAEAGDSPAEARRMALEWDAWARWDRARYPQPVDRKGQVDLEPEIRRFAAAFGLDPAAALQKVARSIVEIAARERAQRKARHAPGRAAPRGGHLIDGRAADNSMAAG